MRVNTLTGSTNGNAGKKTVVPQVVAVVVVGGGGGGVVVVVEAVHNHQTGLRTVRARAD